MKNSISISIRLSARDGDILKVFRSYKPAEALSIAVSKHLGDQDASLSISGIHAAPPGVYKVRIDAEMYPEGFRLLSGIPKGNRSTAVKRLLRYAIPICDLDCLASTPAPLRDSAAKKPRPPSSNLPAKRNSPIPHEGPSPCIQPGPGCDDGIFDLI